LVKIGYIREKRALFKRLFFIIVIPAKAGIQKTLIVILSEAKNPEFQIV